MLKNTKHLPEEDELMKISRKHNNWILDIIKEDVAIVTIYAVNGSIKDSIILKMHG